MLRNTIYIYIIVVGDGDNKIILKLRNFLKGKCSRKLTLLKKIFRFLKENYFRQNISRCPNRFLINLLSCFHIIFLVAM